MQMEMQLQMDSIRGTPMTTLTAIWSDARVNFFVEVGHKQRELIRDCNRG